MEELSYEKYKKLFKPFPDIDRAVISDQTVGLGLSICNEIIRLHEGEIWAESEGHDLGSTFKFTLSIMKKD